MMSRMLGAPLGGTTRGGHHGVESLALSLITPPNGIGGGGSCFPSSVTVALGEPATPVICWAETGVEPKRLAVISRASTVKVVAVLWRRTFIIRCPPSSFASKLDHSCATNSFECASKATLRFASSPCRPETVRCPHSRPCSLSTPSLRRIVPAHLIDNLLGRLISQKPRR